MWLDGILCAAGRGCSSVSSSISILFSFGVQKCCVAEFLRTFICGVAAAAAVVVVDAWRSAAVLMSFRRQTFTVLPCCCRVPQSSHCRKLQPFFFSFFFPSLPPVWPQQHYSTCRDTCHLVLCRSNHRKHNTHPSTHTTTHPHTHTQLSADTSACLHVTRIHIRSRCSVCRPHK